MMVASSLRGLLGRDKKCKKVVRRGVVFIINKDKPRFNARQRGKKKIRCARVTYS